MVDLNILISNFNNKNLLHTLKHSIYRKICRDEIITATILKLNKTVPNNPEVYYSGIDENFQLNRFSSLYLIEGQIDRYRL